MLKVLNRKIDVNKITGLNDIMFRGIMFDHKNILKAIIETSTGEKIDSITLLNIEISKKRFLEMKKTLDVYVESINMLFDIEVSNNYTESIINRNLAFGFKVYTDAVDRGCTYEDYKATCVLNIIGNKEKLKDNYNSYLKNEENKITSKMFLYKEIFADYYIKKFYNKGNKKLINKYKYIIMLGLNLKELEEFNERYGDKIVEEYTKSFKEMLLAKPFEPLFDREEDERRIRESLRREAIREGHKEGMKKGIKEGKKQGIEYNVPISMDI